ncbi:MAG: NADH-quinone oxidoreductase subunit L [Candidatus Omnitrophica bacterium]|nr:NADH-quinone oxidoreductase subunit L [Candidatus Omnitrophota bacterium]
MTSVFLTITVPVLGAFVLAALPKRFKPGFALAVLAATFLSALSILPGALSGKASALSINFTSWFSFSLASDGLAVFMACVSSFVALLICAYSLEYMSHYEDRGRFYFWTVLFVGSMMGLIFSANLMLMYCFWELTAVCSWRLIGFYRGEEHTKAADRAFLVTFFGASLLLAGIVLTYINYGTLEFSLLKGAALPNIAAFLLLGGIIAKSAQLPLQTWLPDAGVAPSPVTALLHAAVLVKIGVYAFARIFSSTFIASPLFLNSVIALSVITILIAAGSALVENNIKRVLAYSTISQLGYIILALAIGTKFAFLIALLYIFAHSLAKAGLFLCAGIIEHKTNTKDIDLLGGLMKSMPLTACAYLLCAFSIIGIAPLFGFWPKFLLILETLREGHIAAGILAVIGALFTLFYLFRLFDKVFLGEEKIKVFEEKNSPMVYVVVTLGVLSLLCGILIKPVSDILTRLVGC